MIEYKGYTGWYEYDEKNCYYRGKVCDIEYPINFSGNSLDNLTFSFHDGINDYLAMCKRTGKEVEKPSQNKKGHYKRWA